MPETWLPTMTCLFRNSWSYTSVRLLSIELLVFSTTVPPFGHNANDPTFGLNSAVSQHWEGLFLGNLSIDVVLLAIGVEAILKQWVEAKFPPKRKDQVNKWKTVRSMTLIVEKKKNTLWIISILWVIFIQILPSVSQAMKSINIYTCLVIINSWTI